MHVYAHAYGARVFRIPVQPGTALVLTEEFFTVISLRMTAQAYSSKMMPDMDLDYWLWASVCENDNCK